MNARNTECENTGLNTAVGSELDNTQVNVRDLHAMRAEVNGLINSPAVRTKVSQAISRGRSPHATPFERYMSRTLADAGGDKLATHAAFNTVQIVPPGEGELARLVSARALNEDDEGVLECVQGAINRLCCLVDALEDSADLADTPSPHTITISGLGGAWKPNRPLYRSAHIPLPCIGVNEQPSIAYLNEVDWRSLDRVAVTCRAVFQSSMLPNMYQSILGAYAPPGSDWDVRTRLASVLGRLELPLACSSEFDCSIPDSRAMIQFSIPDENSFPHIACNTANGKLEDIEDKLHDARMTYAMRLACLMAATGFGAGRHIDEVELEARANGTCLLFAKFNRHDYVHKTLVAIEDGQLFNPAIRFDVARVAEILGASELSLHEAPRRSGGEGSLSLGRLSPNGTRRAAHEDQRELPEALKNLFHARRVCDIDTRHYFGGRRAAIEYARLDSDESVLAAVASLEQTIADMEAITIPPDDDASSRPIYCSNPLSRAMVTLLDDELSIANEAERFLNGLGGADGFEGSSGETAPCDLPYYFRVPDALFQAHVGLSDLYLRLGDYRGAEAEADRCIALAPTTAQSYYLKASALAQQTRYAEAANTLVAALRIAVSERDCALLYYHLALVLWKLNRKQESISVHVYTMSLAGEYAEKSAAVVRNLRQRKNVSVIAHASPLAATREMTRARIPVAPSTEARTLVVQAAIGLSCANFPEAAAPYAAALTRYFRDDKIVNTAARSLQLGVPRAHGDT